MNDSERRFVEKTVDASFGSSQFSEQRSSQLADEFTRLEVQLDGLLLAFSGIFLEKFGSLLDKLPDGYQLTEVLLKAIYALSVFFLVVSLSLGLLHLKRKEKFWGEWLMIRSKRWEKWLDVLKKDDGIDEAMAFVEGTKLGKGIISSSPDWPWILQTVFLGIAIILFFIIFLVLLFAGI